MPEIVQIREQTPVSLETEPLITADQDMGNDYARQLVVDTFNHCERYRSNNHDRRWKINDSLYFGYFPTRFWDGTTVPRSSVGLPITFDQVHSAKPFITSALFSSAGEWFQVEPEDGQATIEDARAQKAAMLYALEHSSNDFGGSSLNDIKLAIHQILIYGNGGGILQPDFENKTISFEWVDLRDVYIDPGASTPSVESARSVVVRKLMTVDELLELADTEGMNIPPKDQLYAMAVARPTTWGDMTLRAGEALRNMSYNPATDGLLPNPSDRFVEVLMYYSATRYIWVLDKKWTAFNEKNELGFIPLVFAPCYIVPGRWHAQGIPDVQEGNQRVSEALINGRLDEIALSLNPPRVRKRGSQMTPSQLRNRPGLLLESDEPANDFIRQEPQQITTNIYQELAFFREAANNRTGLNGAMSQGAPARSNASRTKAGISMQTQGPLSRISEMVDNIEQYLILPMLYKMQRMMEYYHLYDEQGQPQQLPGMNPNGDAVQVPSASFGKRCRYTMKAASRMLTREQMSQMFPFLMQYLFSGPFMSELHKSGKTVNFDEIFKAFQDATGTGRLYNFIRPMTQQEQQALNAPPPQIQAVMQKAQMDSQLRNQLQDKKDRTTLAIAAMGHHQKQNAQQEAMAAELLNVMVEAQNGAIQPPVPPAPSE